MSDGLGAALDTINRNVGVVNQNLASLSRHVEAVSNDVTLVRQSVNDVDNRLDQLVEEFRVFVQKDLKQKELQLAETRLVKVRQELTDKYGYYDEARRVAVGILQAADINVVRQDVINTCTEELMLRAPRYWLAPCLIALAAWLNDNRDLADRALQEAIRRNDERASLFFALIARRACRFDATERWLERYLSMQDPTGLERDMVVVLDAFASGLLGSDSSGTCSRQLQQWVSELTERPGFIEDQRNQWVKAFLSKMRALDEQDYPYLRKYSPTWPQLQNAMEGVRLHRTLQDHFKAILDGNLPPSQSLVAKLDEILDNLVTNFDTEELPLRRDERLFSLIVECDGDRGLAHQKMSEERALDEHVDFTQLLTNAAMHPETANASRATQRLAVALSKNWIQCGYEDLTAKIRGSVPANVDISISEWRGTTQNGGNEAELLSSINTHIQQWYEKASAAFQFGMNQYIIVGIIGLVAVVSLLSQAWLLGLCAVAAAVGYYFYAQDSLRKQRLQIDQQRDNMRRDMPQILKAVLAEVVDWRKQWDAEDAVSADVTLLLDQVSPAQFVSSSFSKARVVLAQ